jgi:hypothetical protein
MQRIFLIAIILVILVQANTKKLRKSWAALQEQTGAGTTEISDVITSTKASTWFSCSNPIGDDGWTYAPSYSNFYCEGTGYSYLGPFGKGGKATSPKFSVEPHSGIIVSLALAWVDSWDNEQFRIYADGTLVYYENHWWRTQSLSNSCQNSRYNDAYTSIKFGFNHTAPTLSLVITSTLDQPSFDESWGICDLSIIATTYRVRKDGTVV